MTHYCFVLAYGLPQVLAEAKHPVVVVGSSCLQSEDAAAVMAAVSTIAQNVHVSSGVDKTWKVLNVLHRSQAVLIDIWVAVATGQC